MRKDITIERKEAAWKHAMPAHATRDGESLFYGLTVDEANDLKNLIPEGEITGDAPLCVSRQFKFPEELPSGLMVIDNGNKVDLWVEYADKRITIRVKLNEI